MRLLSRLACALALLGGLSSSALAQFQTPVRFSEGPGVKLGEGLVFHPGLAIEGRYDSNALNIDSQLKGAPYLRLIGHFNLQTLSPQRLADGEAGVQRIQFGLNTSLAYREYFSGDDSVTAQRALEVSAGLNFRWSPSRYFNFQILDSFMRSVQARNTVVAQGPTTTTLAQDLNRLTAQFNVIPGGGRLSFGLGYSLNLALFEDEGFGSLNKLAHEIAFSGKFKLLPKTAVMLDVIQQFTTYLEDTVPGTTIANPNVGSKPFRVYAGFAGLITPRFSTLLKVGYGNSIHDSGDSFSSILAKVELGYLIGPTAKLKVGFERSFEDSIFANTYTDNKVYAGYDHQIASRFILHLALNYSFRSYGGFPAGGLNGLTELDQHLVTAGLAFDYQIKDWVYVGLGYDLQLQNAATTIPTNPGVQTFGATDFARHQVYGKVGISY